MSATPTKNLIYLPSHFMVCMELKLKLSFQIKIKDVGESHISANLYIHKKWSNIINSVLKSIFQRQRISWKHFVGKGTKDGICDL